MLNTRVFAFLCLVVSMGAEGEHRLTCYLDTFTHHPHEGSCTHIILPPVSSVEDLHLQSWSEDDWLALSMMRERNPSLKILLGFELSSSRLDLISNDELSFGNLIQNLSTSMKGNRLDGLDVMWLDGTTSTKRAELFKNFLKSLKGAFEKETDRFLLSASVQEAVDHSGYDEQALAQYTDFISILPSQLDEDFIKKTAEHWEAKQVNLEKLNLAVPGFHRKHRHRSHRRHDQVSREDEQKRRIHVLNSLLGNQVCEAVKSRQDEFISFTSASEEQSPVKEILQHGFGGIGVVFIDLEIFTESICLDLIHEELAIVERKVIRYSNHGCRHHHDHHHHRHLAHPSHREHGGRRHGHRHHGGHQHSSRHRGHHHHHDHSITAHGIADQQARE